MADYALNLEIRTNGGKGSARKLRGAGRVPAVCYGRKIDTVSVSVDPLALERLLKTSEAGMNTLIDLKVEGGGPFDGRVALVKDLQRDPVSGRVLHADFYAVDLEQKIQVSVPIHLNGTAVGVTMGGILDHALRELELECLPGAIPREVGVDVTELGIGDSLHVHDIVLPEGVALRSDPNLSVVSVVAPTVAEEPVAEEVVVEGAAEGEPGEAPAEGAAPEKPEEPEAKGD